MTDTGSRYSLNFPYAFGGPVLSADFRTEPEDFQVDEELGFEPSGEGEHLLLHVRKRSENTVWLAKQIARIAGVKPMDVGYCGLKDRHAVTTQWFSIYLPRQELLDWQSLPAETVEVLSVQRHSQKLRRGMHRANRFVIRLRHCQGDRDAAEALLTQLASIGVPNYFGEQRFGHGGNNLPQAEQLLVNRQRLKDKTLRGLLISAARSYLFNQVLGKRIEDNTWTEPLPGEVLQEQQPSGPLWGRGRSQATSQALEVEQQAMSAYADLAAGLEHVGLSQERRALRIPATDLVWSWQDDLLELSFSLASGCFATALLRELASLNDLSGRNNML